MSSGYKSGTNGFPETDRIRKRYMESVNEYEKRGNEMGENEMENVYVYINVKRIQARSQ